MANATTVRKATTVGHCSVCTSSLPSVRILIDDFAIDATEGRASLRSTRETLSLLASRAS